MTAARRLMPLMPGTEQVDSPARISAPKPGSRGSVQVLEECRGFVDGRLRADGGRPGRRSRRE